MRDRLRTCGRRTFLRRALGGGLVLALPALGGCGRKPDSSAAAPPAPVAEAPASAAPPAPAATTWRFYSEEEGRTLSAAVERLLPAGGDGGLPGARAVGVASYVDAQLASKTFAGLGRMMRAGVQFLDRTARRDHGGPFHDRPPQAQDAVLSEFQRGAVGGMRFPQQAFFDQLLRFALEGYLGAPEHGGNRDAKVWAALGIDPRCHNMYDCG